MSENPKDTIQKGLQLAKQSLSIKPDFASALSLAVSLEMMIGNHEDACKKIDKIFKNAENMFETALGAAGAHNCGDLELAISNYEYVFKTAPHFSSWARNLYSYALVENGDFDKALKFFEAELQKEHAFGGFHKRCIFFPHLFIRKGVMKKKRMIFSQNKKMKMEKEKVPRG